MTNYKNIMRSMPFSPSRMEALECPFRFAKLYLEKQFEPTGEQAIIGKVFHSWIVPYVYKCLELEINKLRDLSWLGMLNMALIENKADDSDTIRTKTQAMIQRLIDDPYWEMPFKGKPDLHALEQKWGFRFRKQRNEDREYLYPCGWFDTNIDIRMIADLIWMEGHVLNIMDHKTGWGDPWEHQLDWYAAGAYSRYEKAPWDVLKIWYHWPGKGGYYEEVGFYTRENLPQVVDKVIGQVHDARKTEEFPACACRACSWCGFKAECPKIAESAQGLITIESKAVVIPEGGKFEIVDQGTAERALMACIMVGSRLEEIEQQLKDWVKINGPVSIGRQYMEQRTSNKWECTDPAGLMAVLQNDLNISMEKIAEVTGMSKSRLSDILRATKNKEQLGALMQQFGKTETITNEPRIYKGKGDE